LVATVVVLWLQLPRIGTRLWRVVAISLPLMAIATVLLVPSLNARVADTFRPGTFAFESGPQARFDAWGDGLEWTFDRFPIGWGLGEIEENPRYFGSTTAENVFLQVAATVGIAGAVALVLVLLSGIREGRERLRTSDRGASAYFPFAFFVAFAVHGMFGNSLGDPSAQILLGLAMGLVTGAFWWGSAVAEPGLRMAEG